MTLESNLGKAIEGKEKAILAKKPGEDLVDEEKLDKAIVELQKRIAESPVQGEHKELMQKELEEMLSVCAEGVAKVQDTAGDDFAEVVAATQKSLAEFTETPEVKDVLENIEPFFKHKGPIMRAVQLRSYRRGSGDWQYINKYLGSIGIDEGKVTRIQEILGIEVDGKTGPETINAISDMLGSGLGVEFGEEETAYEDGTKVTQIMQRMNAPAKKPVKKVKKPKKASPSTPSRTSQKPTPPSQPATKPSPKTSDQAPAPAPTIAPAPVPTPAPQSKPSHVAEPPAEQESLAETPLESSLITPENIDQLASTEEGRRQIREKTLNDKGEFILSRDELLYSSIRPHHLYRDKPIWVNGVQATQKGLGYYYSEGKNNGASVKINFGDRVTKTATRAPRGNESIRTEKPVSKEESECLNYAFEKELKKLRSKMSAGDRGMLVDGAKKKMYVVRKTTKGFVFEKSYTVATGKPGFGEVRHSNRTPRGMHSVKVTSRGPRGSVIKSKRVQRERKTNMRTGRADITTAILALAGEESSNKSSYSRGIYIHGTAAEQRRLGRQASAGCVNTSNVDIEDIHDLTTSQSGKMYVYITDRRVRPPSSSMLAAARRSRRHARA
jgi:lipoprotein-anchoring transpeptidase ErfK/SrfK